MTAVRADHHLLPDVTPSAWTVPYAELSEDLLPLLTTLSPFLTTQQRRDQQQQPSSSLGNAELVSSLMQEAQTATSQAGNTTLKLQQPLRPCISDCLCAGHLPSASSVLLSLDDFPLPLNDSVHDAVMTLPFLQAALTSLPLDPEPTPPALQSLNSAVSQQYMIPPCPPLFHVKDTAAPLIHSLAPAMHVANLPMFKSQLLHGGIERALADMELSDMELSQGTHTGCAEAATPPLMFGWSPLRETDFIPDIGDADQEENQAVIEQNEEEMGRCVEEYAESICSQDSTQIFQSSDTTPPGPAKRYQCTMGSCQGTFSTSSHLSRHNRIHLDLRPFRCDKDGCDKVFTRRDNMRQVHAAPLLLPPCAFLSAGDPLLSLALLSSSALFCSRMAGPTPGFFSTTPCSGSGFLDGFLPLDFGLKGLLLFFVCLLAVGLVSIALGVDYPNSFMAVLTWGTGFAARLPPFPSSLMHRKTHQKKPRQQNSASKTTTAAAATKASSTTKDLKLEKENKKQQHPNKTARHNRVSSPEVRTEEEFSHGKPRGIVTRTSHRQKPRGQQVAHRCRGAASC
ncbi:hypothetical protein DFJ77DRAFT_544264 [Powellomyces hirtus]|nr:hypothetical protein DFJ77DRAFT_544264 [Powellomyces hirtus]